MSADLSAGDPSSPLSAAGGSAVGAPGSPAAAAAAGGAGGDEKTFSSELWDQVERVYQRLTNGRHDLKRLKTYMEARADMARTWSKSMSKASQQPALEDSSSIGAMWNDMKENGLAQAKSQDGFAAVCMEIAGALEVQIVEVKKQKTLLHDKWSKLLAEVAKKTQAHDKAQKQYMEAVKQAETAIMNRDAAHEQKMPEKAAQKAETRAKTALKEVDNMHTAYQKAVQQLKEAQAQQDSTCIDLLQQFEKLERARLRVFLEQLDRFAAQHDTLRLQIDAVATSLHAHANAVNIDADVQEFIKANTTGKTPAPHVEYVPCKSQILDHAEGRTTLEVPTPSHQAQASGSFVASPQQAPPSPMAAAPTPVSAMAATAPSPSPAHSVAPGGPGAPAAAVGAGAGAVTETAVALYDFDQNEPDDLPFKAGQVIKLLTCADSEEWWQGEIDGRVGIFPKAYVSKQAAGAGAAPPAASPAAPQAQAQPPAANPNVFGEEGVAAAAPAAPAHAGPDAAGAAEVPRQMDAQCAALFDFAGQDDDELSFTAGQTLVITGELHGWYMGKVLGTEKVGIFPSNFVQMNQ